MDRYISFKMTKAAPMNLYEYSMNIKGVDCKEENKEGYYVVYPDGYESWCPKEVFEATNMQIADNCTISQQNVDDFIADMKISTIGEKTTVVHATLMNGFEIIESSSCVDPANYNEILGADICKQKIKDKIWNLLGFLLQTARYGMKR